MKVHLTTSDEDLMKAYQGGDFASFEVLYDRHRAKVYGFLIKKLQSRSEAEDVFQATFMKLHTSRKHYDPTFKFSPWLFTVCQSVLKDHFRRKKRIVEDSNEEILNQTPVDEPQEGALISMESLEGNQKIAVQMRYDEDLSFDEIAKKLKTSPTNVRQLISRAIRKLRKENGQEDL